MNQQKWKYLQRQKTWCDVCAKTMYKKEITAKHQAEWMTRRFNEQHYVYKCLGGWHITKEKQC